MSKKVRWKERRKLRGEPSGVENDKPSSPCCAHVQKRWKEKKTDLRRHDLDVREQKGPSLSLFICAKIGG